MASLHICFHAILLWYIFTRSNSTGLGKCPKIEGMGEVNLSRFAGHWYEVEKSFHFMEIVANCVNIDLEYNEERSLQVRVTSTGSWSQIVCGFLKRIDYLRGMCASWLKDRKLNDTDTRSPGILVSEGIATGRKNNPASFMYRVRTQLPRIISKYLPGTGIYQVVDTDYDSYAILYSCSDIEILHADLIWIWARQKELDVSLRAIVYEILEENKLDPERLILADNKNCTD